MTLYAGGWIRMAPPHARDLPSPLLRRTPRRAPGLVVWTRGCKEPAAAARSYPDRRAGGGGRRWGPRARRSRQRRPGLAWPRTGGGAAVGRGCAGGGAAVVGSRQGAPRPGEGVAGLGRGEVPRWGRGCGGGGSRGGDKTRRFSPFRTTLKRADGRMRVRVKTSGTAARTNLDEEDHLMGRFRGRTQNAYSNFFPSFQFGIGGTLFLAVAAR